LLSLQAIRRRLPLWAFILLAVLCLVLLGIACACATDHQAQTVDRALSTISATPAVIEIWTFSFAALSMLVAVDVRRRRFEAARSPALLQRFLF
jgi:hypothetical protein